jgi:threonine/homoserine/homoserine lactone efflux protein
MIDPQLVAFIGVITILTVTPSATTMLITRSTIASGQGAGLLVVLGGSLGVFVHALVSALGLSLILVQSAQIFEVVKLFGAAYLIFLGVQSIWRAYHQKDRSLASKQSLENSKKAKQRSFLEGFLTIILSPETAVFYLAMLPQFISYGESVFLKSFWLGSIHAIIRVIWYSALTIFIGRTITILNRSRIRQWLEMSSGVALIFFGFKVATARR